MTVGFLANVKESVIVMAAVIENVIVLTFDLYELIEESFYDYC
jgi:hypothetical protein